MFIWSLFIVYRLSLFAHSSPVGEGSYVQEGANISKHHYLD